MDAQLFTPSLNSARPPNEVLNLAEHLPPDLNPKLYKPLVKAVHVYELAPDGKTWQPKVRWLLTACTDVHGKADPCKDRGHVIGLANKIIVKRMAENAACLGLYLASVQEAEVQAALDEQAYAKELAPTPTPTRSSRIEMAMHDWTQLLNHANEAALKETWQLPPEELFQRILVQINRSKMGIWQDKYNQCKDPACRPAVRTAFIRSLKRIAESFVSTVSEAYAKKLAPTPAPKFCLKPLAPAPAGDAIPAHLQPPARAPELEPTPEPLSEEAEGAEGAEDRTAAAPPEPSERASPPKVGVSLCSLGHALAVIPAWCAGGTCDVCQRGIAEGEDIWVCGPCNRQWWACTECRAPRRRQGALLCRRR